MRKVIFKRELYDSFKEYSIKEDISYKILQTLFVDPLSDVSKQYVLKEEIVSIESLEAKVRKLIADNNAIADIKSIFLVEDDFKLPDQLRAYLSKKLPIAVFVGAGVSKLVGIPLWNELANLAIDYLHEKELLTFYEGEKIKSDYKSPKQKMSIFHKILPKDKSQEFYGRYLISRNIDKSKPNPYEALVNLECPKVSTNLDQEFFRALLDKLSNKKPLEQKEEHKITEEESSLAAPFYKGFDENMNFYKDTIYQIHGSFLHLKDPTIITMRDYLKEYHSNSGLRRFLAKLFNEYSVIFLGYGLEEFEILEHCVAKTKQHYVLIASYLSETNLFRMKKHYFSELGVDAIPYYLDFKGYSRLFDILSAWVKQINFEINSGFYSKTGEYSDVKI